MKSRVTLSGVGVHSGRPATVVLAPADADTGVVFHVAGAELRGLSSEVGSTDLCTVIGDLKGAHVATVEHLMATVSGLGLDNVLVEVEGDEVPILDGSAAPIAEAIAHAGLRTLTAPRRYVRVLKQVRVESGASWAEFRPHAGTRYEIEIDFDSRAIGRQFLATDITPETFVREVARARTFGFMKDVERLWAAGYALGSSLENSVVIGDDHRVINLEGLRFENEFVRHKMLDAMGDLALAGARILGCFRSYRGGHRINAQALRRLLADATAYEIIDTPRRPRGRIAAGAAVPSAL